MALRVVMNPRVEIFESAQQKSIRFQRAEAKTKRNVDAFERQNSGDISIDGAATEDLPFGDVDAVKGVHIQFEFSATATVAGANIVLNAGADSLPVRPAAGQLFCDFWFEGNLSQIAITNADPAEVLKGVFAVWGDPTP
jgi:hypothetical protein